MPILPSVEVPTRAIKASDIIRAAFYEAHLQAAGEEISGTDRKWGLEKLQRLVDLFNAKKALIIGVQLVDFTLISGHTPYIIGPGGDFDIAARPVAIKSASIVLSGGTEIQLEQLDDDQWAAQSLKASTCTLPTAYYYSPDSPLGTLIFWMIPTQVNTVRLQIWTNLTDPVTADTTMALPPAYWDALVCSLAVALCPSYDKDPSPTLVGMATQALKAIIGNNNPSPRLITAGSGLSGSSHRPDYNFLTGQLG